MTRRAKSLAVETFWFDKPVGSTKRLWNIPKRWAVSFIAFTKSSSLKPVERAKALVATLSEAIGGFYWNIQCGLHIWDYSSLPFSFIGGQINLFFSLIWMFLSGIVIILDDILRWKLYKEERPEYYVHGKLILKI